MKETRSFAHVVESVTAARRFATEALHAAAADVVDAVELMVSELASNCIRHTSTGFDLTIIRGPREIRVEASDRGGGEPAMRSPGPDELSGRGLQIVDMLSDDWGYERAPDARKTVWFTVSLPGAAAAGERPVEASQDPTPRRRTGRLHRPERRARRRMYRLALGT
jgi:anti-sigma regulatory factor (Ser/Thr protein kinase)